MTYPELKHGVSAVVCCYNSAAIITPTIQALARQTVPTNAGYEVILVDNNCTDDTVKLAQEAWINPAYPLHIIHEAQPGLIYARKAGVFKAQYQILLFIDDDNILEPGWIEPLLDIYSRRPDVGGVGGCSEPLFSGAEDSWERPHWFERFLGMYACTPPRENPQVSAFKQTLYGAGLSLRTQVLRSVFDPALPFFLVGRTKDTLNRGDDSEICLRAGLLGWKLWYESSLKLKHNIIKSRVNWEYVLQARRGGGHAEIILKIYRDLLEGKTPLTYSEMSEYISSLWQEFWQKRKNRKDLLKLIEIGEKPSLRYHYLQGFTDGFFKIDKHEYDITREKIIAFFPKRNNG